MWESFRPYYPDDKIRETASLSTSLPHVESKLCAVSRVRRKFSVAAATFMTPFLGFEFKSSFSLRSLKVETTTRISKIREFRGSEKRFEIAEMS